jgi:hypothetical protein
MAVTSFSKRGGWRGSFTRPRLVVHDSKYGSVTLRADRHLHLFIYLVLRDRAYSAGSTLNSSRGQPALMDPLLD